MYIGDESFKIKYILSEVPGQCFRTFAFLLFVNDLPERIKSIKTPKVLSYHNVTWTIGLTRNFTMACQRAKGD